MERSKKQESAINTVNRALEILENPYDTMDIVQKKKHALFLYSKKQHEAISRGDRVSESRANMLGLEGIYHCREFDHQVTEISNSTIRS